MKLLFLIAAVYLLFEYLNYLNRKEGRAENNKSKSDETVDKALKEAEESLSSPAKQSLVDVYSTGTDQKNTPSIEEPAAQAAFSNDLLEECPIEPPLINQALKEEPALNSDSGTPLVDSISVGPIDFFESKDSLEDKQKTGEQSLELFFDTKLSEVKESVMNSDSEELTKDKVMKPPGNQTVHCFIDEKEVSLKECDLDLQGEEDQDNASDGAIDGSPGIKVLEEDTC
ncbi:hypothetical protein [Prochlorococcus sp. MIT 1307]|uniref:hypothetical protein n=1 Tax=Prochlorococcus sp. MIT 1307 TaxID=3096219 RepID=UPI002A765CD7|nr:hypothetical protein [Prochlorococcus sp. MIT 1307]